MLRPLSLLPALVAVVATLGVPAAAAAMPAPVQGAGRVPTAALRQTTAAQARPAPETTPLSVTIDALSPSYVPRSGPVRVTGSVTNTDDVPWLSIHVYSFISSSPMTSASELKDAAQVDPAEYVGDRVTAPGTSDTLDRIEPGETAQYSIKVPRSRLPVSEPGVYWFGVHALGETAEGRVEGADGRARTFLPLVPPTRRSVKTALVVPLRHEIARAPDGTLEDPEGWVESLSPGGRLRSMVDFGASAGSRPLTWLVDPALPDAVRALAAGNPPRSLGPTPAEGGESSPGPEVTAEPDPASSTEEPSGDSSGNSSGESTDAESTDAEPTDAEAAAATATATSNAWLDRLHEALRGGQVFALPYGDLDVAAAAERDPDLYRRARKRSSSAIEPWGIRTNPVVSSPSGYLDRRGLELVARDATVLVTDRMFEGEAPPVVQAGESRMVTASSAAASGGPGPDDRLAPVAMRQRIVSEAALRLLSGRGHPLVVVFPHDWNPTATTGFFEGLDIPWLHLVKLRNATNLPPTSVPVDELRYPARQSRRELDNANFSSAESLIKAGQVLQAVLPQNDDVASQVADEALTGTSYWSRLHPDGSRAAADRSREWIDGELGSIQVSAPRAVYLSSASGRFAATISNGLDQPVRVSIKALADNPLSISGPDTVDVGPQGRATVLLTARTRKVGVHNVTLMVTATDGTPLGSSDQLPIRSAQVSDVIWLILGTGVALLFGAIAVRLVRRVRAARAGRSA